MKIDLMVVFFGLIQLALSLFIGIFFIFAAYRIFKFMTKNIDDEKELKGNNIALSVFMAGTIFAVVWISRFSVESGMDGIAMIVKQRSSPFLSNLLIVFGLFIIQILISGLIAFTCIWIAIFIFMKLTKKIDEMKEIKNNNIAVSIIYAIIIIGISIFIAPAISVIMNGLIPYPVFNIIPK